MVKGQHVGAGRNAAQGGKIGVRADHHVGVTCAAGSSAEVTNTRRFCPSAMAA